MLKDISLLVSLSLCYPPTTKTDKEASEDLENQKGTTDGQYRAVKRLFRKTALAAMKTLDGEIGRFHKKETAPWGEEGQRILLTANFDDYMRSIRDFKRRREDAARDFEREYPSILADARYDLKGAFDLNDYPAQHEVRECFQFKVKSLPIPDAADFRIDLPAKEMAELSANVARMIRDAEDVARMDLAKQIITPVVHMVEKLSGDTDGRWYNSMVENISDIADRIPRLNVTGDPVLASLASRLKADLTRHPVETLKENKLVRTSVKKRAQDILDTMSVFMGPVSQEIAA